MSIETNNDMIDSGSGANSSGGDASSGGGATSSDVVTDKDVERALANPSGMSQEMINRFLENSDGLKPELVKELQKLDNASLGMKDEELQAAERQQEQQEQERQRNQQVEEAAPAREQEVDFAKTAGLVREAALQRAFEDGKNAHDGVETAHAAVQELGRKSPDQMNAIQEALSTNKDLAGSIDNAMAGIKGLMAGNMLASTKDLGDSSPTVAPKDTKVDAPAINAGMTV
jgi:hypothetical protein